MYYLLLYDYVPDMLQRRDPFRPTHLALVRGLHERGELLMAGAWNDPVDGAAIVFSTREAAESFVRKDPYVANGLVTAWKVREWNVGVGEFKD